jgi:hypothetical protein
VYVIVDGKLGTGEHAGSGLLFGLLALAVAGVELARHHDPRRADRDALGVVHVDGAG